MIAAQRLKVQQETEGRTGTGRKNRNRKEEQKPENRTGR